MNTSTHAGLAAASWRKASKSSGGGSNCVQVAVLPAVVAIRDSKNPDGTKLTPSPAAFRAFTENLKHHHGA